MVSVILTLITLMRIVESVGEGVHEVVEGDIVIPNFLADYGECTDCFFLPHSVFSLDVVLWVVNLMSSHLLVST
ncbi:putative alcohol dehydrogenase [Helianthus debilis subsp. tardiflorus]